MFLSRSITMNFRNFKQTLCFLLLGFALQVTFLYPAAWAIEVNKGAVTLLLAKDKSGNDLSTGTGFIVDPSGILVTNYHVLVDAASLEAVFPDGRSARVERVIKVDRVKDFAILKLQEDFYSTLELGNSSGLELFQFTQALGYPTQRVISDKGNTSGRLLQTYGFVVGVLPQANPDFSYIYTTADFDSGFSGGPLLDKNNRVVGIATIDGRSLNLALPIDEIKPFLNEKKDISLATFVEQDLQFPEADYFRGNFYLYEKGEPEEAIESFNKVIAQKPDWVPAYNDLATAYRDLGDTDKAIENYKKVLEINPQFAEALTNLGSFYFRAGKIAEARDLFEKAVKQFPNFVQALSNLGATLNKLGEPEKALSYLHRAVKVDPEFEMAYFNLGNSYFEMKQWESSENSFNRAVSLGVDFLSLHWKLYEIYKNQGASEKVKQELSIILQIDPENEKALKEMGDNR
jgi:tetratricopeptide (TPR) repeat protein